MVNGPPRMSTLSSMPWYDLVEILRAQQCASRRYNTNQFLAIILYILYDNLSIINRLGILCRALHFHYSGFCYLSLQ